MFPQNLPSIDAKEAYSQITKDKEIVVLDVRTPEEYGRGKIEGSINLPVDEVGEKIEKIIPDKNKKIFVYCFSGSRSVIVVSEMLNQGYKNVFNITSGILAWRNNQLPLV